MSPNSQSFSELYSAYAAGRLSPPFALLVETQSALRADIAGDVAVAEEAAGAILESEQVDRLAPNAFEKALKAIDALDDRAAEVDAARTAGEGLTELLALPEPLRTEAIDSCGRGGWQKLTKGVQRLDLGTNSALYAHLYRIEPGSAVPHHTHRGNEYTLVVQGGFTDDAGSYGPGDICCQTPSDFHQPVADQDGVCFALAVSEGGMKFTGVLGILQKLSGR
ncbi:MAG: cupin domain-containing protein [Henriciella sp.]